MTRATHAADSGNQRVASEREAEPAGSTAGASAVALTAGAASPRGRLRSAVEGDRGSTDAARGGADDAAPAPAEEPSDVELAAEELGSGQRARPLPRTAAEGTALSDSAAVRGEPASAAKVSRAVEARAEDDAADEPPAQAARAVADDGADVADSQPLAAAGHTTWQLFAGGQALLFSLPAPVWLGVAGVELARDGLSLQLGGIGGGLSGLALGRGRADLSLAGGELHGCGGTTAADLHAQLCLGVMGAGVFASGEGFAANRSATSAWGALTMAAALRWPRYGKLALRLSVRGLFNAMRPELVVDGTSERLLLARLGASGRLELIFSLP